MSAQLVALACYGVGSLFFLAGTVIAVLVELEQVGLCTQPRGWLQRLAGVSQEMEMGSYVPVVQRKRDGSLQAENVVFLGNRRELMLSTRKHHRGGLVSDATVSQVSEDGQVRTHAIGFGIYGCGDFSRTVERDQSKRCTEKNVREMHAKALLQLDGLAAEALTYYAVKDAPKVAA